MSNNNTLFISAESRRREFNRKSLPELKRIGKKQGLLNVDQYTNATKHILVERVLKGKQLSDESKKVLIEKGRNEGLKLNGSMSKNVILQKMMNPKLTDLNKKRLEELADQKGIRIGSHLSGEQIIQRLENPTKYYTIELLLQVATDNNIDVPNNIKRLDLINILVDRNLITTTPIKAQESNLGVSAKDIPEALRRVVKKKGRNARERLEDFKEYIKNLKRDYITPSRLKKLSKQLEKKEEEAKKERERIFTIIKEASAFKNFTNQYIINGTPLYDPISFLKDATPAITNIMNSNRNIKVMLYFNCLMKRIDSQGFEAIKQFAFHSKNNKIILEDTDVYVIYQEMIDEIEEEIQKVEEAEGSGWIFEEVESLVLHTSIWDPLKAGSYIDLPQFLKNKGAMINMKNEDDKCFMWCVLRALNPKDKNAERIDKDLQSKQDTINMKGIRYPVDSRGINQFESQNPEIAISLLGYNKNERVYSLRISKDIKRKHQITLLLIKNEKNSHYCLVKNLSALLASQVNNHKGKRSFCLNCLNGFNTPEKTDKETGKDSLDKHKEYCYSHDCVKLIMQEPNTFLKFEKFVNSEKAPFVIYADFESKIIEMDNCNPNPNKSYTKKYQKHEPVSFSYYIKSFNESVYESRERGYTKEKLEDPDVVDTFIEWLEEDVRAIANIPEKGKNLTEEEKKQFNEATKCWICKGEFDDTADEKGYIKNGKVEDHCHYTGRFRGAAHNNCNLNYRKPKCVPVFFHNLSGYDSHLFIKKMGCSLKSNENLKCIPYNHEKFLSFTKTIVTGNYIDKQSGKLKNIYFDIVFKDTLKFLSESLETLVNNQPKDDLKIISKNYTPEQVELIKQKGFYPYEYMDSEEKFKDTKLPPREAFYSKLSGEGISVKDYKHAQNVWNTFKMKTFKDYHELYNETDVLLLADVFENFRDICLKEYELDPAHYYTAPGLAWDACLKMTNIKLELLSDIDMLLMFEKGIRGGISIISNRYGEANNKYMKDFDKEKPSKYLMYLDANNLYGCAMSMNLPTHGFKWLTNKEMENIYNNQVVQVWEKTPCILEVDLEYPEELHDLHNDYPFCSEKVKCENRVEKLIPNLRDKTKYVIHYRNLIQCLKAGMKLKKIHRGIKFVESEWLKPYIEKNTNLRTKAKNNFEKDFYKLMNNSVFGKTMENIRNRVDVKLVNTKEKLRKLVAKPNLKGPPKIFSEDFVTVQMKRTSLKMDKPVYLGMCILDLSKTIMYEFHYKYIKPKYGDKAKLLFTDTDSLMYEIETEDFYKDISGDVKDRFDMSDYPENHPSGIPTGINKKVLGMFKDEAGGKNIKEFVGLRSKLYSTKMENGGESKKCKGIKKQVVKNSITHEDYKTCLTTGKEQYRKQNIIRSYNHDVYTEEVNKIALSAADDKRYILGDGMHTLAWGHYKIKEN